jgi:predicted XRE-type DNA-binding protein
MKKSPEFEVSSGNVFADLGLRNPEVLLAKADLVYEISRTIEARGLTQAEAAEILGVDQPKVSALVRGRLDGFSMERLYRYLNALGKDIEIVVRPASGGKAARSPLRVVRVEKKTSTATRAVRKRRVVAAKQGKAGR